MNLEITGDKELARLMTEFAAHGAVAFAAAALVKAAEPILADAKAGAPVASGALLHSLEILGPEIEQEAVRVTVETGTREALGIAATDPYFYPSASEFGTSEMPARSFMRPAFEAGKTAAIEQVKRELRERVEALRA